MAAGRRQWAAAGAPHMVEMAAKRTVGGQEAIAGWHPTVADNAHGDGGVAGGSIVAAMAAMVAEQPRRLTHRSVFSPSCLLASKSRSVSARTIHSCRVVSDHFLN